MVTNSGHPRTRNGSLTNSACCIKSDVNDVELAGNTQRQKLQDLGTEILGTVGQCPLT